MVAWMDTVLWEQLVRVAACAISTTCITSSSRLCRLSNRVCLTSRMATCSSLSYIHLKCTSWHVWARTVASNSSYNTHSPRICNTSQRACVAAGSSWPPLTTVCILDDAIWALLLPNRNARAVLCVRWNWRVRSHLHSMRTHNSPTFVSLNGARNSWEGARDVVMLLSRANWANNLVGFLRNYFASSWVEFLIMCDVFLLPIALMGTHTCENYERDSLQI